MKTDSKILTRRRKGAEGTIHLFTAAIQKATNFVDDTGPEPMRIRSKPRRLLYCGACGRRRWAEKLNVQVYYDGPRFFCQEKCK